MNAFSKALLPYARGFIGKDDPFLDYVFLPREGDPVRVSWKRGEFWKLARKAAFVLKSRGLRKGERFLCGFGENRFEDLAFRLASVMTGTVPVTVNWQADSADQAAYKILVTGCSLVLHDASFDAGLRRELEERFPGIPRYGVERLENETVLPEEDFCADLSEEDERIVIFTSGTTGNPKGVRLSYGNYANNSGALGGALLGLGEGMPALAFLVNPLHHTNSSAVTDCFFRHGKGRVTLLSRYGTAYWRVLAESAEMTPRETPIFAFVVARHFDFLEQLHAKNALPVGEERLKTAMNRVNFTVGSAPVGPTTVERLVKWSGRVPMVRFGSTESTFQVSGIPAGMTQQERVRAFERGWAHVPQAGYFIGHPHPPFTELEVVKGIDPGGPGFMVRCGEGEAGYLVSRGGHIMKGTVQDSSGSRALVHDGWYLGFRDIGFFLENVACGQRDFYWVERDSALLIRGGANTACEAVGSVLGNFLQERYGIPAGDFDLAVVGLRLESEHEDACCVTLELKSALARSLREELRNSFIREARVAVARSARPDLLRFGPVPRTFKGTIQVGMLKKAWMEELTPPA